MVLAGGEKHGYKILYTGIDADGNNQFEAFTVNANPAVPGRTGEKYFFVDQSNVIRFSITGPADATSSPVPPR